MSRNSKLAGVGVVICLALTGCSGGVSIDGGQTPRVSASAKPLTKPELRKAQRQYKTAERDLRRALAKADNKSDRLWIALTHACKQGNGLKADDKLGRRYRQLYRDAWQDNWTKDNPFSLGRDVMDRLNSGICQLLR
ncbi:MAG TPA: hypothetical protein VF597_02065 [Candidatus Saccharimonadales bacterium]|jgi:hypothetical protein